MTIHPREIYDLLLDSSSSDTTVSAVMIGLTWTLCQTQSCQTTAAEAIGLCMSPGQSTRTLPWSGTLAGQPIANLTPWIKSWDSHQAAIGMAAINAVINSRSPLLIQAKSLYPTGAANLAVFEHFLPQLLGQKVVVIGRYPGLERYEQVTDLTILERQPTLGDLPDIACEYLLPEADWVFLTATTIANKTFPRLVELAQSAKLVLMGPTVPWLPQLGEMGIDYLAGVAITDPLALRQTIAEGGGTRIFGHGLQYQVLPLASIVD